MNPTRFVLLTVFSAVVASTGLGQSGSENADLRYRTPRTMNQLESANAWMSETDPAGSIDKPSRIAIPSAAEAAAFLTGISDPDQPSFETVPAPDGEDSEPISEESGAKFPGTEVLGADQAGRGEVGLSELIESDSESIPSLFAALPSMRSVSVGAPRSPGILPENYAETAFSERPSEFQSGGFLRPGDYGALVNWCAPYVGYRPLYFEDVWLERHGYDRGCCQPLVSAAKFYGRIPLMPYMVGATPCHECTYSLGLGRPGDCPPHFFTLPKRSRRGLLYQAACVTGTVFLIP